jgi:two-component system, chemotaxis family, chemotaxis protein CheY
MKALVVDKSNTMRSVLSRMLSMRGFEVAQAEGIQPALQVLQSAGIADLVLVDWPVQDVEDLEFITRLRHKAAHHTTLIVLVSAEPGVRTLRRAFIAGADDYLMKPFTSLRLDEKLTQAGFTWQL